MNLLTYKRLNKQLNKYLSTKIDLQYENLISISSKMFNKKDLYIFERLKNFEKINLVSLKNMFLFLLMLEDFLKPTITLNSDNSIQLSWKKSNIYLININFILDQDQILFVMFIPSQRNQNSPVIFSNCMHLIDFISFITQLNDIMFLIKE